MTHKLIFIKIGYILKKLIFYNLNAYYCFEKKCKQYHILCNKLFNKKTYRAGEHSMFQFNKNIYITYY